MLGPRSCSGFCSLCCSEWAVARWSGCQARKCSAVHAVRDGLFARVTRTQKECSGCNSGNLAELLIPRGTATVLGWGALCPESCVPRSTITVFFLTLSGKLAITQVLSLERAEAPCPGPQTAAGKYCLAAPESAHICSTRGWIAFRAPVARESATLIRHMLFRQGPMEFSLSHLAVWRHSSL